MIGDWVSQWPALIAALAVIQLPGLALLAGLRVRGLALWALAPVASTAVLAVLAVVLSLIGIPWSAASVVVGCLVLVAAAFVLGFVIGPRRRERDAATPPRLWVLAGLFVGIVVGALRLGFYIGLPEAISQTNDAVFHLNSLRYVLDSGSASSLDITGMLGSAAVYPAAWHALTSLVVLISGASIPVAANMVSLVIAAAVWPVGIVWFTLVVSRSPLAAGLAGALSPLLLAFPMLMLEWGVLYPYALAVALLPATVGVLLASERWIADAEAGSARVRAVVLAVLLSLMGMVALGLAQPAVVLAWALLAIVWATWKFASALRRLPERRGILVGGLIAAWLGFSVLWVALTLGTLGSHWAPFSGKLQAVVAVVLNGPVLLPYAFGVSILMVVGLVVAVRRPSLRWLACSWIGFAGLYVLSAAIGQPLLRRVLVGAWYADPYRLAALLPVTVIPLAAVGLSAIVVWASRALASRGDTARGDGPGGYWAITAIAAVGIAGLLAAPVVQMPRIIEGVPDEQSRYASDGRAYLSPDERSLLEELPSLVPEGARVIGNPSTGTGFGYMLGGADVYPRSWQQPTSPEWAVIADGLRDVGYDDAVCEALEEIGSPAFALDFGAGEESPGRFVLPGMTDFEGRPGFELVQREGAASLWEITACP